MKFFITVLVLIFSLGCQKKETMRSLQWEQGHGPRPEIPQDLNVQVASVSTKAESIERFVQKWGEAEVEGAFLQVVKNKKKAPVYMKMKFADKESAEIQRKVTKLFSEKQSFLKKAKKTFSELNRASFISPVKIIVSRDPKLPAVFYQFDVISQDNLSVKRWKMATPSKVLDKSQVHSCYDGQGMAFPNGPQWSQIEEVLLPNLVDGGSLKNLKVNVITQSGLPALSTHQAFFFKPEDPRFDQVQVFYYANKMIQQFKDRLGVELPFSVELKTHIGYPDKKTAMFYYDHRIHLGQGDDVTYKEVLKDPTIVMHEMAHAFVDALAGLPQGALNEAFADFFTTSFLDTPYLGEASYLKGQYTRSVDNQLTFDDRKDTVYGDSQIVSGLFWHLRKLVGVQKAEELALKTLIRLGPDANLGDVGKILQSLASRDLAEADEQKVLGVLRQRKFPLDGEH